MEVRVRGSGRGEEWRVYRSDCRWDGDGKEEFGKVKGGEWEWEGGEGRWESNGGWIAELGESG